MTLAIRVSDVIGGLAIRVSDISDIRVHDVSDIRVHDVIEELVTPRLVTS